MDLRSLATELEILNHHHLHVEELARARRQTREELPDAEREVFTAQYFLKSWQEQLVAAHRALDTDWAGGHNLPSDHPAFQRIASADAQVKWGREQVIQAQQVLKRDQAYLHHIGVSIAQLTPEEQLAIEQSDRTVKQRTLEESYKYWAKEYQEAKTIEVQMVPVLKLLRRELERLPPWQRKLTQQHNQLETGDKQLAKTREDVKVALKHVRELQEQLAVLKH